MWGTWLNITLGVIGVEGSEAGERAETTAHRAGERGSSRVTDGVWGERREA